jgi:hypothetical protein
VCTARGSENIIDDPEIRKGDELHRQLNWLGMRNSEEEQLYLEVERVVGLAIEKLVAVVPRTGMEGNERAIHEGKPRPPCFT